MAKLTKRTTEQLRSYLGSLSADELVDVLLSQAARDDALRDRLLIESAKRGAGAVDLKSFQRSINAAVFDLAESRYGSEYTYAAGGGAGPRAHPAGERRAAGGLRSLLRCRSHGSQAEAEPDEVARSERMVIGD